MSEDISVVSDRAIAIADDFLAGRCSRKMAISLASFQLTELMVGTKHANLRVATHQLLIAIVHGAFEGETEAEWRLVISALRQLVRAKLKPLAAVG